MMKNILMLLLGFIAMPQSVHAEMCDILGGGIGNTKKLDKNTVPHSTATTYAELKSQLAQGITYIYIPPAVTIVIQTLKLSGCRLCLAVRGFRLITMKFMAGLGQEYLLSNQKVTRSTITIF